MLIMERLSTGTLRQIVNRLVGALHPQEIYLFGSHAGGKPHRDSDVDLLVVVPDDAGDCDELSLEGRRRLLELRVPVDLLVYHRRDMDKWSAVRMSLPGAVVRKGRLLYAA